MSTHLAAASAVPIDNLQLAAACALLLVNVALSVVLKLQMSKQLLIAGTRMVVQLLLIGLVLQWVFTQREPAIILGLAGIMALVAGLSAVQRTAYRYPGIYWNCVVTILGSAFIVTGVAVGPILQIDPWFDPHHLIPLLGMVLGNGLNGVSLAIGRFLSDMREQSPRIEMLLALGATRYEAAREQVRTAVRTGMVPLVNSMAVMGIVSLPGMMTGQILGGADPNDAVRYQILIMFMIAAATSLATISVVLLAWRQLIDDRLRLRHDRLTTREK